MLEAYNSMSMCLLRLLQAGLKLKTKPQRYIRAGTGDARSIDEVGPELQNTVSLELPTTVKGKSPEAPPSDRPRCEPHMEGSKELRKKELRLLSSSPRAPIIILTGKRLSCII